MAQDEQDAPGVERQEAEARTWTALMVAPKTEYLLQLGRLEQVYASQEAASESWLSLATCGLGQTGDCVCTAAGDLEARE